MAKQTDIVGALSLIVSLVSSACKSGSQRLAILVVPNCVELAILVPVCTTLCETSNTGYQSAPYCVRLEILVPSLVCTMLSETGICIPEFGCAGHGILAPIRPVYIPLCNCLEKSYEYYHPLEWVSALPSVLARPCLFSVVQYLRAFWAFLLHLTVFSLI